MVLHSLAKERVRNVELAIPCNYGYKDLMDVTVEADKSPEELKKAILKVLLGIHSIEMSCQVSHTMRLGRIDVVPPGSLSLGRPKTVRIVDRRDKAALAQACCPED